MNFLDDDMSVITGQYQGLLTMEEVIDRELILLFRSTQTKTPSRWCRWDE